MRPLAPVLLALTLLLAGCATPSGDDDTTPTPTPTPSVTTILPPTEPTPTPTTPEPTPASPTPTPTPASPTPATPTPNGTSPPPASVSIVNIAQGYAPATLTVPIGTNVTWKNNDPLVPHTATSEDGTTFDTGTLSSGASASHVFTTAGTFPYVCSLHSNMKATVVVA